MIKVGKRTISNLVINSIMGHGGGGDIFPLYLYPSYRDLAELIRETETTVITKSATRHRRKAPLLTVRKYWENGRVVGLINAYGLKNAGVEVCAHMIKTAISKGFRVIPSYAPDFSKDFLTATQHTWEAINIYSEVLGADFWALEIDGSCPNLENSSPEENEQNFIKLLRLLRMIYDGCIIFKYGPTNSPEFLAALEADKRVDIFNGTNTFHHSLLYPDPKKKSPLAKYGGGAYSGEIIFPPGLDINRQLRTQLRSPMILGGGISSMEHVDRYANMICSESDPTCNSLGICSVIRTDPDEAKLIIHLGSRISKKAQLLQKGFVTSWQTLFFLQFFFKYISRHRFNYFTS